MMNIAGMRETVIQFATVKRMGEVERRPRGLATGI
jgi:hypothetical protein